MSTKTFYFHGDIEWLKKDDKFKKYSCDLYMDPESWDKFEKSGALLKHRDKEGRKYVSFSRPFAKLIKGEIKEMGPPLVLNKDGEPMDMKIIGNGSKVTVKVNVFDTMKGKGTDFLAIRVDELKEYKHNEVDETEALPF